MFPELRRDFTLDRFYSHMKQLASDNSRILAYENLSPDKNLPIISIKASGTGCEKQRVLFTAMHSGVEYSGSNTLIRLLDWLVSGEPEAEIALQNCEVTIVPIPNPHGYRQGEYNGQFRTQHGGDPYAGPWSVKGVCEPDVNWEAYTIQELIDDLNPELYIDCHGVFYKGQTMIENTGVSVHGMNRPHHTGLVDEINAAAGLLGYHCEQYELMQKPLPSIMELADRRYQISSPAITSCTYAYYNYHTLAMTMEIGHEESGLARLKKSLSLADHHWDGEATAGYPVNRIFSSGHFGLHPYSNEYDKRRSERTDLWKNANAYSTAYIQPQFPGHEAIVILAPVDSDKIKNLSDTPVPLESLKGMVPDSFCFD